MTRYTVTPWRTQADLLQVRQQLYTHNEPDTDARRHAVDRVMVWKLRGNLPHAVESTALLVEAILHHDTNVNSAFSIRAVYSAAFCRFVTGFCDIGRHKERTLEPSSMLEIARQIDMPAEFVALRHEATHEELPGIRRLVIATRQALDWLWKVYWNRLGEPEDPEVAVAALATLKGEVASLLRNFRRSRVDALRSQAQDSPEQLAELSGISNALVNMCKDSRTRVNALTSVLVEERLILPSNRVLGSSMEGAFLIWDELWRDLSLRLRGFVHGFIDALLESITKPATTEPQSDSEKEALAMWVQHLLDDELHLLPKDRLALEVQIVKRCCLYPGYWTQKIGRDILDKGEGDLRADWLDFFNAVTAEASETRLEDNSRHEESVESKPSSGLDVLMNSGESRFDHEERDFEGGWKKAVLSSSTPLGVVN